MRLPLIKEMVQFVEENDEDFLLEAIETLEHITMGDSLKDSEMDVIGEILSNFYGAIEVSKEIKNGTSKRDALNGFMRRVMGSIDK
tara:strand:- start:1375 stop:1632 length:258 start_codon:yes stop_codon:yes gene_type:complete